MDAIHYDKIADKLVNFHSKLANVENLEDERAKEMIRKMKITIMTILHDIDVLSDWDDKGWIR